MIQFNMNNIDTQASRLINLDSNGNITVQDTRDGNLIVLPDPEIKNEPSRLKYEKSSYTVSLLTSIQSVYSVFDVIHDLSKRDFEEDEIVPAIINEVTRPDFISAANSVMKSAIVIESSVERYQAEEYYSTAVVLRVARILIDIVSNDGNELYDELFSKIIDRLFIHNSIADYHKRISNQLSEMIKLDDNSIEMMVSHGVMEKVMSNSKVSMGRTLSVVPFGKQVYDLGMSFDFAIMLEITRALNK